MECWHSVDVHFRVVLLCRQDCQAPCGGGKLTKCAGFPESSSGLARVALSTIPIEELSIQDERVSERLAEIFTTNGHATRQGASTQRDSLRGLCKSREPFRKNITRGLWDILNIQPRLRREPRETCWEEHS